MAVCDVCKHPITTPGSGRHDVRFVLPRAGNAVVVNKEIDLCRDCAERIGTRQNLFADCRVDPC